MSRIELGREAFGRQELVDVRLNLACELLEHKMLVLHLGAELGGLEQALAIPLVGLDDVVGVAIGRNGKVDARQHPVGREGHVAIGKLGLDQRLGLGEDPAVLGVEDVLDGGEADILVYPAIAGDVVRIQQLVVVEAGRGCSAGDGVHVRHQRSAEIVGRRSAVRPRPTRRRAGSPPR